MNRRLMRIVGKLGLISILLIVWCFAAALMACLVGDAFGRQPGPLASSYEYQAVICDVYDGDTVTADIHLGLGVWVHDEKLRLLHIDAPELRGDEKPAGIRSRDYLCKLIGGRVVTIRTDRDRRGKYGRILAEIWAEVDGQRVMINDLMVTGGYAVRKDY
jgi:micrococcal nuclease